VFVKLDKYRLEHERQLIAILQERLGREEVHVAGNIQCESPRKFRWEISYVKHDILLPWAQHADMTGGSDYSPMRLHIWRAPKV